MKRISYLTMVFLPAYFVAVSRNLLLWWPTLMNRFLQSTFGMNISELVSGAHATLAQYFAVATCLTLCSIWVLVAFHRRSAGQGMVFSLSWPARLVIQHIRGYRRRDTVLDEENPSIDE